MELLLVAACLGFIAAGSIFGLTPTARRMTAIDTLKDTRDE
ncbi:hypothetical protein [Gordonia insulae]|uniref:Uncharacterized protein n=1 Tax=Gordonia insulae TaxID=2420509 RepID=A0A3G8JGB3_9ACTN|nr:hypothetical protein [Gordonia insulae]AZG43479.1 hypothetical protein D7316_00044 [Gordonia insulae]